MKKLLYIANIRLPTEKAHGVQIMKMCEAFARSGISVTLIVSSRETHIHEDSFAYYDVEPLFKIRRVWAPDIFPGKRFGYLLHLLIFSLRSIRHARVHASDVVYTRDEAIGYLAVLFRLPTVWESHVGKWNFLVRTIAQKAKKIIVISEGLRNHYSGLGISPSLLAVAHDGIDVSQFEVSYTKESARAALGLPAAGTMAMYIGALEEWKGYRTFLESLKYVPEIIGVVVGGKKERIDVLKSEYPNVYFLGPRPYKDLPRNQQAADVLVIPNTAKDALSSHFTSPLKVFAHMAAGVPVVASDVPSIREILDDTCAYLSAADDPEKLAENLKRIQNNPVEAQEIAARAREKVKRYTWDARAKHISSVIW